MGFELPSFTPSPPQPSGSDPSMRLGFARLNGITGESRAFSGSRARSSPHVQDAFRRRASIMPPRPSASSAMEAGSGTALLAAVTLTLSTPTLK